MPNAYQRRLAMRREAKRQRHEVEREEQGVWIDSILKRYEDAYFALYNETVRLHYKNGWVKLGSARVHLAEVTRRASILEARLHEQELATPEEAL